MRAYLRLYFRFDGGKKVSDSNIWVKITIIILFNKTLKKREKYCALENMKKTKFEREIVIKWLQRALH